MSEERIYKLLTLVLLCKHQEDYHVVLEVHPTYETIQIFTEGDCWRYSTDCLDSYEDQMENHGVFYGVHDENLTQAEEHILKILKVKET